MDFSSTLVKAILLRTFLVTFVLPISTVGCVSYDFKWHFSQNGTSTLDYNAQISSEVLRAHVEPAKSDESICARWALDPAFYSGVTEHLVTRRAYVGRLYGDCHIAGYIFFPYENVFGVGYGSLDGAYGFTSAGVHVSQTEGGWQFTLEAFDELIEDQVNRMPGRGREEVTPEGILDVVDETSFELRVSLPGRPARGHNAHHVEGGDFVWKFHWNDFGTLPTELRAVTSLPTSEGPNRFVTYALLAGAIGSMALVVPLVVTLRNRRRQR